MRTRGEVQNFQEEVRDMTVVFNMEEPVTLFQNMEGKMIIRDLDPAEIEERKKRGITSVPQDNAQIRVCFVHYRLNDEQIDKIGKLVERATDELKEILGW